MPGTFDSSMNRSNANTRLALEIPERVVGDIIQDTVASSVALQLGNVHRMSTRQERLRLLNSLPEAKWINGTTDAGDAPLGSTNNDDTNQAAKDLGLKQTTQFGYDNVYLTPDEIAVLVVMPDAWRDDSSLAWEQVREQVRGAFARKIDEAIFWGASSGSALPSTFGDGILPETVAKGNVVYLGDFDGSDTTGGFKNDRADAYAQLAQNRSEAGYEITNFVVAPGETWNLRRQRDGNGALLNAGQLFGLSVAEVRNGTWDASEAIALTGDFSQLHIGVRQDLTFTLSNSATIFDDTGAAVFSAFQQDAEVLRAVMRVGYVVTDPLKTLTGQREYPFAALLPGATPS